MEFTKENYYENEERIIKEIKEGDFISFDLELSGLLPLKESFADTPSERYNEYKHVVCLYRIIQLGITIFKKEGEYLIAKPYKFYAFPCEEYSNGKFNMGLGSIIFNRNNGCDFNKWICQGISYLNSEQERKYSDHLYNENINKYNPRNKNTFRNITLYRKEDHIKFNNFFTKFHDFIQDSSVNEMTHEKFPKHLLIYFLNTILDNIRNTIYIKVEKNFMKITKCRNEVKNYMINEEDKRIKNKIKQSKGLRNLYLAIVENKKKLIGHNCIFDLMFIIHYFGNELPNSYELFKLYVSSHFGVLYDTKYLYKNFSKNDSFHLNTMFKELKERCEKKVKIKIPEGLKNYLGEEEEEKFHHADYDAFATGCSYAYMISEYGESEVEKLAFNLNLMNSVYDSANIICNETLISKEVLFVQGENIKKIDPKANVKFAGSELAVVFVNNTDEINQLKQALNAMSLTEYKENSSKKYK